MRLGLCLLELAAKVALDRVLGSRTDEAMRLFQEWWSHTDATARTTEVAAARGIASDPQQIAQILTATKPPEGKTADPSTIEALTFTLSSGFNTIPEDIGADPSGAIEIEEQILPGKSKTFVLWLNHPAFSGPGRYVHFNWDNSSWRVRDYLGGKIFHPPGTSAKEPGLTPAQVSATAGEIWKASRGPVQSLKQYGLGLPCDQGDEWRKLLALLIRAAEGW